MDKYARLEPFDPAEDSWEEYAERLQMAFTVNEVDGNDAVTLWKEGVQFTKVTVRSGQAVREVI